MNQEEFWSNYNKLSLTYKALELNGYKKYVEEKISKGENDLASRILLKIFSEEKKLVEAKTVQDKKSDELLLVKEVAGKKRK